MDLFDSCHDRLAQLVVSIARRADRNEASTRLQIIDPLLFECLGWQPEDVHPEKYIDGGYIDYLIGKPYARLVIEAKKESVGFELPAGIKGKRGCKLSTVMTSEDSAKAIRQALGYAQQHGVPVAAISNGHQLVAFLASRQDGIAPLEGRALVFSSLDEMLEDFTTFWNFLSRDGVLSSTLQHELTQTKIGVIPPEKLSQRIGGYPGFRPRTSYETDLKTLGELFILDIQGLEEVAEDFVEQCYCTTGALSQYSNVSREILRTRYGLLTESQGLGVEPAEGKKGLNTKLTSDVVSAAMSRRPLILLGDVGVGKTMFLQRLIRVDAREVLANVAILYINFGNEPALANDINEYVTNRLVEELDKEYGIDIYQDETVRAVYNGEINQFRKGIYKGLLATNADAYRVKELERLEKLTEDQSEHLRRVMEHFRGARKKLFLIVLDNVDQRPMQFQEQVFLIGQSLAERWPATVFMSLRPSTFYQSKSTGSLAAYQPRVFTISPARIDEVLAKRLKFARSMLVETGRLSSFPEGLTLDSKGLISYIDVLIKAFDENHDLKELLDNLSGGNIRQALDFVTTFVGSAYVRTERILSVAESGGTYTVPMHEFIRAIMYGDHSYYDPEKCSISNVFDIVRNDGREHFLQPILLAFVQRLGQSAGKNGFVDAFDLHHKVAELGYSEDQILAQLSRAQVGKLIEFGSNGSGGSYRITSIGSYMHLKMPRWFAYIDAIVVDTPIVDVQIRTRISDVYTINDRLDRADVFRQYLDQQWNGSGLNVEVFDWPGMSMSLAQNVADARRKAAPERNASRQ